MIETPFHKNILGLCIVRRLRIARDNCVVKARTIDRVESALLLSLIGGGLVLCALGAAVYDVGRVFSVW
jgi:hypothetical protein